MDEYWVTFGSMPRCRAHRPRSRRLNNLVAWLFFDGLAGAFVCFWCMMLSVSKASATSGLLASSRLASSVHHFLFAICQPACLGSAQLPLWWNARRASTRLLQHFWRLCCFLTRSVLQTTVAAAALYNRVHELSPLATAVPTVDISSSHPLIPRLP